MEVFALLTGGRLPRMLCPGRGAGQGPKSLVCALTCVTGVDESLVWDVLAMFQQIDMTRLDSRPTASPGPNGSSGAAAAASDPMLLLGLLYISVPAFKISFRSNEQSRPRQGFPLPAVCLCSRMGRGRCISPLLPERCRDGPSQEHAKQLDGGSRPCPSQHRGTQAAKALDREGGRAREEQPTAAGDPREHGE